MPVLVGVFINLPQGHARHADRQSSSAGYSVRLETAFEAKVDWLVSPETVSECRMNVEELPTPVCGGSRRLGVFAELLSADCAEPATVLLQNVLSSVSGADWLVWPDVGRQALPAGIPPMDDQSAASLDKDSLHMPGM